MAKKKNKKRKARWQMQSERGRAWRSDHEGSRQSDESEKSESESERSIFRRICGSPSKWPRTIDGVQERVGPSQKALPIGARRPREPESGMSQRASPSQPEPEGEADRAEPEGVPEPEGESRGRVLGQVSPMRIMSDQYLDTFSGFLGEIERSNMLQRHRIESMQNFIDWMRTNPSLEGPNAAAAPHAASVEAAEARVSFGEIQVAEARACGEEIQEPLANTVCPWWSRGHCVWGEHCALSHDGPRGEGGQERR